MGQWADRQGEFLDITQREIGRLGGGRKKLRGRIDIAMIQSLIRNGEVDDRIADYGHVIMDECHHVPAPGFAQVADRAKARYVTGLSATVTRKDGQHPTLFMQCGPIRHRVDARRQAARRPFSHQVLVRPTGFRMPGEPDRVPRPVLLAAEHGRLRQCRGSRPSLSCQARLMPWVIRSAIIAMNAMPIPATMPTPKSPSPSPM